MATTSRLADAKWEGEAGPAQGEAIVAGRSLALRSGCAQFDFAGGATVIIEGPARFTLASPAAITLSDGKLAARVIGGGFTVHTPTATVLDLGTEFGVATSSAGTTDVEVFKGKVQAAGATSGGQPRILTEGEAAAVSAGTVAIDPGGAMPQRFVRSLSTEAATLDVVDLVAGGDGTTHRRGIGIDPATGRTLRENAIADFRGDGVYHRVPMLPAVDGCFVPDGTGGRVQVDSSGDRFPFPPTGGTSFNRIWAGGAVPSPGRPIFTTLHGVDYSKPGHGLLFIHSNTGLTLDLATIRRLRPGAQMSSFHCTVGNAFVPADDEPANTQPRADAYVIVDGKLRFQRRGFTNKDDPFQIYVPLTQADRFLTLATTDGGDRTKFDWVIWADAGIDLVPEQKH